MWWIMRGWGGRVVKSAVYTTRPAQSTKAAMKAAVIATIAVVMTKRTIERDQWVLGRARGKSMVMRRGKAKEKRGRGVRMRMRDNLV
ncbi:hypothetical protein CJF30_00007474 [Rutstroemia sp. NJR-2017a BBW]|nr:hypothetical protein CJF30_00007474 [Rutstroemia sp. NJR-2017a BBW]